MTIEFPLARRSFLQSLVCTGGVLAAGRLLADEQAGLKEPIHRIAKVDPNAPGAGAAGTHPLDPALKLADDLLVRSQRDVVDYSCTMIKRERIKGELTPYEWVHAKIRNRKKEGDNIVVPLSVYLKFLKPKEVEGREVVWVEGLNNNKMRAHEGGLKGRFLPSVWLDPHGPIAMHNQLHPITDIGIENLILKLIEKGTRDRQYGECEVTWTKEAKLNGELCTVLNVRHPIQRPHFEFHLAQIFLHDTLQLPVRYVAYHWPTDAKDTTGPVIEEYTHVDVKLNQGFKDADFDSNNPNYNF